LGRVPVTVALARVVAHIATSSIEQTKHGP